MNDIEQMKARKIIERVAAQYGTSVRTVRREMQIAIDYAFIRRHMSGNDAFVSVFGDECPSVEEFIIKAATLGSINK